MKLYDGMGPNPRVVRMFAAEKGVELEKEAVDLMAGENRQEAFRKKNAFGQLPCLELPNGQFVAEITAICEYLDEVGGGASLVGTTPEERAETRMWTRRVDLNIVEPLANGFRFGEGLPLFKERIFTIPEASDGLKEVARQNLTWLDGQLSGKQFLAGDRFTLADVLLWCFLDFGGAVGQPRPEGLANLEAWFERVSARPSVAASA